MDVRGTRWEYSCGARMHYQFQNDRKRYSLGGEQDESPGWNHERGTIRRNRPRTGERMKRETIAIHSGYEIDPTTKAVAVPIYQTVSFAFDSTEHAAALFNLEAEPSESGFFSSCGKNKRFLLPRFSVKVLPVETRVNWHGPRHLLGSAQAYQGLGAFTRATIELLDVWIAKCSLGESLANSCNLASALSSPGTRARHNTDPLGNFSKRS